MTWYFFIRKSGGNDPGPGPGPKDCPDGQHLVNGKCIAICNNPELNCGDKFCYNPSTQKCIWGVPCDNEYSCPKVGTPITCCDSDKGEKCFNDICRTCQPAGSDCKQDTDCCATHLSCQDKKCDTCPLGSAGTRCQYTRDKTCNSHGLPDDNGNCTCDEGYYNFAGIKCAVTNSTPISAAYCDDMKFGEFFCGINGTRKTPIPPSLVKNGFSYNLVKKYIGVNCPGGYHCPS